MSVNGHQRPIPRWDGASTIDGAASTLAVQGPDDDDPSGAAKGMFNGLVMAMVFWVMLALVIWLVFLRS